MSVTGFPQENNQVFPLCAGLGPKRAAKGAILFALALNAPAAFAVEVPTGCSIPPAEPNNVFYVDPVNGSASGNGSQASPWNSLQAVVSSINGQSPLLSSVPYWHRLPSGQWATATNPAAPVNPGDIVYLMSGNYGNVVISVYESAIANSNFVTIAAAPGQTPVLNSLLVKGTNKWHFQGLTIPSLASGLPEGGFLVSAVGQSLAIPNTDIIFDSLSLSSQNDISAWSQAQWVANGASGFLIGGGAPPGVTTCTTVVNSQIYNVKTGAGLLGNNLLFTNNTINNFAEDAIDYAASNITISYNLLTNSNTIDDNHNDFMQGQIGYLPSGVKSNNFQNILIDSNIAIRQTNPNLSFPGGIQGIDAFDEDWTNLTVQNNVVATSSCWGIGYGSVHGGLIINNTVLDDLSNVGNVNSSGQVECHPQIYVGGSTHEGSPSNNVTIRNNISHGLGINNSETAMQMDHNICTLIGAACSVSFYVNGTARWYTTPGVYGDGAGDVAQILIDSTGAAGEFIAYNPLSLQYELQLLPGAPAVGAGSSTESPILDVTGAERGSPTDIGAYAFTIIAAPQ